MARVPVRLNHPGVAAVLQSEPVRAAVEGLAAGAAAAVNAELAAVGHPEVTATVEGYTTDRAAAQVVILHPAAAPIQAKYGVLTRGAGAVGLQVKSYG